MGRLPTPSVGLLLTVLVLGVVALTVNSEDVGGSGSAAASPAAPSATSTKPPQTSPKPSGESPTSVPDSDRASMDPLRPHLHRDLVQKNSPPALTPGNDRSGSTGRAPIKRGGVVYLTFDDGPGPYTPAILNVLRATHSTATFFELGFRQAQYPAEAGRIRAAGSSVGNHTYNHPNLTKLTPGQIRWQVAHGPRSRCVRPPYGVNQSGSTASLEPTRPASSPVVGRYAGLESARRGTHRLKVRLALASLPERSC